MEGDLAVERGEGSKPEHAPSSDTTDSVKVEGHMCDFFKGKPRYINGSTTVSMTTLQHYAAHCSACCLLSHAADANLPSTHREDARITISQEIVYTKFYSCGTNAENGSTFRSDPFFLFTPSDYSNVEDLPFFTLYNVDSIPRDTSSNASRVWAERQIAKCNQDHNCLSSAQGSPLPSRVLDVSLRDAERSIRLLTTTNQHECYVCLSHCWGDGASVTKTTRQNLDSHTKAIAIDKLPKTFQDAVDITRRLGIDYLWIDSLCIVQDSEDDWETEASRMADIYEGAYLTIAATASVNSSEGCQHFNLDVVVPYRSERFDEFPLLDRGWAFQERFLSPRVLHFCDPELVFECRNGGRCQCNHERSDHGFKADLMRLFVQGPSLEDFEVEKGWWAVLRRYTRLKLTYDKDILTALSGITRRVGASQPTGDYVAGIWKSMLPYSLLWYAFPVFRDLSSEKISKFRRSDTPRAPSWSWASVNGPIQWMLPDSSVVEEPLVKIHDISCEMSEVDTYGQAYGGVLSITGPILTSNLCWRAKPSRHHSNNPYHYNFEFSNIPHALSHLFFPDYPFFAYETGPWTVHCLWVLPTIILVLKSLEEPGVFERIGLLTRNLFASRSKLGEARKRSSSLTVKII